jgi:hypothetical protein
MIGRRNGNACHEADLVKALLIVGFSWCSGGETRFGWRAAADQHRWLSGAIEVGGWASSASLSCRRFHARRRTFEDDCDFSD